MTDEAAKYRGLTINECREAILRDLQDHKLILKIEPITRNVGTCWRCQTPIEIISKRQWFMKTREMTEAVIEWSSKVNWIPAFARKRMIDWASSLDWDWVISRQRVFGTPIPVWYCVDCGTTLVAREDELPVDPKLQKPSSSVCQRCGSMSFVAETDVMDTWMDSSITCAVHGGWPDKPEFLERLFPADLQQNGLDIIRTWDYYLMVKHLALLGKAPYKTVLINGMVRGTDGRMMHRHLGNYVEASEAIKKYGADAVRQWAASGGSTGSDIPFRWEDVEYGRRFLTKLWNASRFIISNLYDFKRDSKPALEVIDKWIIARLEATIRAITDAFENFQFNTALENLRRFAWHDLCDNYLEAVKYRLYQTSSNYAESRQAAQFTLFHVLDKLIRLLAPFCPHITESINRALWKDEPAYTSIHRSKWPVPEFLIDASTENEGELLIKLISEIRRMKAENHVSLKSPIKVVTIYTNAQQYDIILRNTEVLKRTLKIENFIVDTSPAPPESKKLESIPSARVIIEFG
jgi:valyl-tRNA synthetase